MLNCYSCICCASLKGPVLTVLWVDFLSFCWLVKAQEALLKVFLPGLFLIPETLCELFKCRRDVCGNCIRFWLEKASPACRGQAVKIVPDQLCDQLTLFCEFSSESQTINFEGFFVFFLKVERGEKITYEIANLDD